VTRVALALVLLAACKPGDAAPACGAIAGNFVLIASRDLDAATVDAETRRAVRDQLPAMRDALDHACTDDAWSATVRSCLYAAKDTKEFQTCETQLTEAQRRELDRLAAGKKKSE
jgi:hypothetical protein